MVKITEVNQIDDFITPFDSFHKVFEIVSLVLSLGTNWWQFMWHVGHQKPFEADNFFPGPSRRLPIRGINSIRPESNGRPGHPQTRGTFIAFDSTSTWDSYPCMHWVSRVFVVIIRLFIARSRYRLGFFSRVV
jgi:hypothetical protein